LLWAGRKLKPIRLASIFNAVDPVGRPVVLGDRPSLDDTEANLVASYLDGGVPVHQCLELVADVLDPGRGEVVPVGFRGDGRWIWPTAAGYYLRTHGIVPESAPLTSMPDPVICVEQGELPSG
jgi:hypothetical protein